MMEFIAGHQFIELKSLESTNNFAAKLLECQHPVEGTVILSHKQTKGKGQRQAVWVSEAGKNLTFSLIIYPKHIKAHEQMILNQAISLAILKFIQEKTDKKVEIKWPNDILVQEQKICGILIENSISGSKIEHSILGIGLNVNQEKFDSFKATSLKKLEAKTFDLKALLSQLLESIDHYLFLIKTNKDQHVKEEYLNHLFRFKMISKYTYRGESISAKIEGVDSTGRLVLTNTDTQELLICSIKEIGFVY